MPNAPRRSDSDPRQEWLRDISNEGDPSGKLALEVAFDDDDPKGTWTTHLLRPDRDGWERRLSRGHRTAIVIEGLSQERQRQITDLIHRPFREEGEEAVEKRIGSQRYRILVALGEDDQLRWAA